jgi:hypothetical protein
MNINNNENTMKSPAKISNKSVTKEPQKRGRKALTNEVKVNKKVHLFFTASDKEILIELAKENNTTIGRFVKSILEPHIARRKRMKK